MSVRSAHMHTHTDLCADTCVYTYMWKPEVNLRCYSETVLLVFWHRVCHWNLGLTALARPAGMRTPEIYLSSPPHCRNYKCAPLHLAFHVGAGDSNLLGPHFINWAFTLVCVNLSVSFDCFDFLQEGSCHFAKYSTFCRVLWCKRIEGRYRIKLCTCLNREL